MKFINFSIIILFLLSCGNVNGNGLENINQLKWKNRIFLIKTSGEEVINTLKEKSAGIDERHVIWFCLQDEKIITNYSGEIKPNFIAHLENDYFKKDYPLVLLIGKDGGIKSRDKVLSIRKYFELIDSMPMRQSEMKNQANSLEK